MKIVLKILLYRYYKEITSETHFQSKLTFINRYILLNAYILNVFAMWFKTYGQTGTFTSTYI